MVKRKQSLTKSCKGGTIGDCSLDGSEEWVGDIVLGVEVWVGTRLDGRLRAGNWVFTCGWGCEWCCFCCIFEFNAAKFIDLVGSGLNGVGELVIELETLTALADSDDDDVDDDMDTGEVGSWSGFNDEGNVWLVDGNGDDDSVDSMVAGVVARLILVAFWDCCCCCCCCGACCRGCDILKYVPSK